MRPRTHKPGSLLRTYRLDCADAKRALRSGFETHGDEILNQSRMTIVGKLIERWGLTRVSKKIGRVYAALANVRGEEL